MGSPGPENENARSVFCCPNCRGSIQIPDPVEEFVCNQCSFLIRMVDSIPILIKDIQFIEKTIQLEKQKGKTDWYEGLQSKQWEGPYRHHLKKRREYLDGIIMQYSADHSPRIALDLGCGDGNNLRWLGQYVPHLYASDYNLTRLRRAAQISRGIRLFMADITDYPVDDNSFDIIFFNHVLEHIREDETALAEVYRVLRPGGLLILGVPNGMCQVQ